MRTGKLVSAAALGAALVVAVPARAADCWDTEQASAARIRDLQSKMMVATMRCHVIGIDVATAYNAFIRTNRARLESINGTIKARFAGQFGSGGQFHYDKFTTSLANAYGADRTDAAVCASMTEAAREAETIGGDIVRLLELADRVGSAPTLPGGRCNIAIPPVTMASASEVTQFTAIASIVPTVEVRPVLTLASLIGGATD